MIESHKLTDEQVKAIKSDKQIVLLEGERLSGKSYVFVPWMSRQISRLGKGRYLMSGYNLCQTDGIRQDFSDFLYQGTVEFSERRDQIVIGDVVIDFIPSGSRYLGRGAHYRAVAVMLDEDRVNTQDGPVRVWADQGTSVLIETTSGGLGEFFFGIPNRICEYLVLSKPRGENNE